MGIAHESRHYSGNSCAPERQRRKDSFRFSDRRRDRLFRSAIHRARSAAMARHRSTTTACPLMNSQKLPRGNALKNFSEIERTLVCRARRRRANYLRLLKQLKASPSKNGRRALLIGACAFGLLAANAQAAVSAPELFNRANAAQRAGRLGPAILGYERARLLSPSESSVEQNLRIAREKAEVNAPAIPVWRRPAHWLGFDEWAVLGSCSLVVGCALLFGKRYVPRRAVSWIGGSCAAPVFFPATSIGLRWNELDRAVIQNAQAKVHIAPAANAQSTFELKAGETVSAQREYGDFVLVRTLDQRSGWVS